MVSCTLFLDLLSLLPSPFQVSPSALPFKGSKVASLRLCIVS